MSTFIKIGAVSYNAADYQIPVERTFRDAWEADENSAVINVNLEKAKDIWRDKIREARKPMLEQLDTAYMRALETGADTTQIIADKQVLRDAPAHPNINAATSVSELIQVQLLPNYNIY
jgi:hypothetical protein